MKLMIERKPKMAALFLILALAFLSAPSFAQSKGTGPSLEQVSAALAKNKVTRGLFVLERTAANGKSLKSSGEFAIASDYGIIWKTIKPIKSTQVVAKEFSLTESAGGKRVKMDADKNPVYKQMALFTSSLWKGDLAAAQYVADIKFRSDENSWQIEMFPKDQAVQMALEKIVVEGKSKDGQAWATKMQMLLKGGNAACYNMSGHSFAASLSETEQAYFD
ncbi:MAG: hypothetical protein J6V90_04600 [Treponema sp.]|nr:hypothetical protein [Treponema sp.]